MSLNRAHIQYVLNQFDAGASPHRILDCLQKSAFLPGLKLATVEQCLRENGRITYNRSGHHEAQGYQLPRIGHASNLLPPANQGAPGLSATTQEVYQVPVNSAVQTFATDAVADPDSSESWDALADRFVMAAYQTGHSVVDIWATLRSNGYKVTQTEVRESLTRQRLQMAGWSRVTWKEIWFFFFFNQWSLVVLFFSHYELEVGIPVWADGARNRFPPRTLQFDEN